MFAIDQSKMEQLVVEGLRTQLADAMRSQWGTGQKLRNMVDSTIGKYEIEIEQQIKRAVITAINSDEFVDMARKAMLESMRGKFTGAAESIAKRAAQDQLLFEGVMRAAGKRMAGETTQP